MKPLFYVQLNPTAPCDLPSILLSLLELCIAQTEECVKGNASTRVGGSGSDWPSHILQVMIVHWLGVIEQLLDSSQVSEANYAVGPVDSHPVSDVINAMMTFLQELMERMLALVKQLHKASCQEGGANEHCLDGASVHTLLPSITECLCSILRRSGGDKCVILSIRLALAERLLPTLCAMLPLIDEIVWKVGHPQEHARESSFENQDDHDYSSVTQRDELTDGFWLAELGSSCCSLCGLLCAELLRPQSEVSDTACWSERDIARIERIIRWRDRGQLEVQHGKTTAGVDREAMGSSLSSACGDASGTNDLRQALFSTGLSIVNITLQSLVTDAAKLALFSEITGALISESKRERDSTSSLDESASDLFTSVAALLDEQRHSSEVVEETLAIWCVPLATFGALSEEAAGAISKAGVVESLRQILLRHTEVLPLRADRSHTAGTSHRHEAASSPDQDVSRGDLQSVLPPKLRHALSPLLGEISVELCRCGIARVGGTVLYRDSLGPDDGLPAT